MWWMTIFLLNPAYLPTDYAPEPRQEVAVLPSGVNAATIDAEDDDEFDENANWWEDYCLVVKAPTVHLTHHAFMHTKDQKWTIDLFKVLNNMNAPDSASGDTLSWARGASNANYSFNPPGGLSQSKSVDLLFDAMPIARQLLPTVVPIMCGDVSTSTVVVFDFVSQVLSLLQNPNIMQLPITTVCKSHNGTWWSLIRLCLCRGICSLHHATKPSIICSHYRLIARTLQPGNQRFSLKPYMFTPAIATERFWCNIKAWRYHGFLPKVKLSSAQNQIQRQGNPMRNYHN